MKYIPLTSHSREIHTSMMGHVGTGYLHWNHIAKSCGQVDVNSMNIKVPCTGGIIYMKEQNDIQDPRDPISPLCLDCFFNPPARLPFFPRSKQFITHPAFAASDHRRRLLLPQPRRIPTPSAAHPSPRRRTRRESRGEPRGT